MLSTVNIYLFVLVFALWWYLIAREHGIGIGFRFLYGTNLALFFLFGPIIEQVMTSTNRRSRLPLFDEAFEYSIYGFLAYLLGGYVVYPSLIGRSNLATSRHLERMADPGRLNAQWKVAWWLIAIGFASLPVLRALLSVPTVQAIFGQLHWMVDTGLAMLCLYASHGRRLAVFGVVVLVLLVKGLLFSAMTGLAGMMFVNGTFLICLTFLSTRFRVRTLLIVAVMGVLAFMPAQMWLQGRQRLRGALSSGASFQERLVIATEIFLNPENQSFSQQGFVSNYRDRADYSDLLAAAMTYTPAFEPYGLGKSYLDVFIAPIPRFLWPEKPLKAGGNAFVSQYTGIRFDPHTSVGVNYMFEFYVNFGLVGVVFGLFVLGLLLGWMELLYYRYALDNLFYEYCLLLCAWSVCLNSDTAAGAVMTVLPAIILCLLIHSALRRKIHSQYMPPVELLRLTTRGGRNRLSST
jgi:hypothetical protein